MPTRAISGPERTVLRVFTVAALVVGVTGATILASQLDDKTLPSTYWEKLLTITGVAALPLVAVAVLVIRAGTSEGIVARGPWGGWIIVGGLVAFAVALVVILIALYELVTTPAAGKKPDALALWLATLGAGLTLGAVASSVAAAALDKIDDVPDAARAGSTSRRPPA